jgi:antirestriction protein ArdC
MNAATYRKDLTEKVIQMLEEGTAPWVKPWNPDLAPPMSPINGITGRPYQGGNSLWLQCQGFSDPRWATYKSALAEGFQVQKGQKGCSVEYWQWTEKKRNEEGLMVEVKLETPKVFYANVFNFSQMENVPEYRPQKPDWEPTEVAERILLNSGATIRHDQSNTCFYRPASDSIHLVPKHMFEPGHYYSTALHELSHWSGHPSRLDRDLANRFGSEQYSREELRAELASFFLSVKLGIEHDPSQHASYIQSWIQVLKQDHNEIHRASRDAEKICEYVLQFQQEKTVTTEAEPRKPSEKAAEALSILKKPRSKEVELEC